MQALARGGRARAVGVLRFSSYPFGCSNGRWICFCLGVCVERWTLRCGALPQHVRGGKTSARRQDEGLPHGTHGVSFSLLRLGFISRFARDLRCFLAKSIGLARGVYWDLGAEKTVAGKRGGASSSWSSSSSRAAAVAAGAAAGGAATGGTAAGAAAAGGTAAGGATAGGVTGGGGAVNGTGTWKPPPLGKGRNRGLDGMQVLALASGRNHMAAICKERCDS